jgi:hypothetical protein
MLPFKTEGEFCFDGRVENPITLPMGGEPKPDACVKYDMISKLTQLMENGIGYSAEGKFL